MEADWDDGVLPLFTQSVARKIRDQSLEALLEACGVTGAPQQIFPTSPVTRSAILCERDVKRRFYKAGGGLARSSTESLIAIDCDVRSIASLPSALVYASDNVAGNLHAFILAEASSNASGPLA